MCEAHSSPVSPVRVQRISIRRNGANPFRHLLLPLAVAFLALPADGGAQQGHYFPGQGDEWEHRTPEQVGMNAVLLQEAVDFAIAHESPQPRDLEVRHHIAFGRREPLGDAVGAFKPRGDMTGVILRHGYIVAEWGEPHRVDQTFSVAKSFLSTTVGLAYDRGFIRDVHDRVAGYMAPIIPMNPECTLEPAMHRTDFPTGGRFVFEPFASDHNRKITWDHLLRQTSDWEGTLWCKPDWADRPSDDPSEWLDRERHEPGSVYKYNDTRVNLLALASLTVWREPLPEVLRKYVMDPIGASRTWRWHGYQNSWIALNGQQVESVSGGSHWGGGMFISARDMARFGYLTLRGGRWGDQQLISEEWMRMARTPGDQNQGYGFMNFMLNTDRRALPAAPDVAFYHSGAGSNIIYVDPVNDIVIVARWIDGSGAMNGVIERVLGSIQRHSSQ